MKLYSKELRLAVNVVGITVPVGQVYKTTFAMAAAGPGGTHGLEDK